MKILLYNFQFFKMPPFDVSFSCDLDSVDNIESMVVREYCELIEYSNFNICINISDSIEINFNSDIMTNDIYEVELFLNKYGQSEHAEISFNSNSGPNIIYNSALNMLYFNVFSYKEGTLAQLENRIKLNSEKHDMFYNVFDKLFKFKTSFCKIRVLEDEEDDYSESEM